jgi:hypothetical protein
MRVGTGLEMSMSLVRWIVGRGNGSGGGRGGTGGRGGHGLVTRQQLGYFPRRGKGVSELVCIVGV